MATRLRDIADKAGVSLTTVSHVLHGYTKSRIKQETCEKVLRVADELGYRPNAIARSLKTQRTNTIGLYTGYGYNSLRDPFLAEVYTGIQIATAELHYDFLAHGDFEGKPPNEIKLKLSDGKISGLIVHAPPDDPLVAILAGGALPAVAIADRQAVMPSLVADDDGGIRLLVDYLWERGHRHIAYLTSQTPLASIQARSATFQTLIAERGGRATVMELQNNQPESVLADLMNLPDRPTAVCCWNDYYAYILISACLKAGIAIPDELAVVGFDGLLETRLPARRLVTVGVPWEHMASEAVRMLVREIEGEPAAPLTVFPVALIAGDTA